MSLRQAGIDKVRWLSVKVKVEKKKKKSRFGWGSCYNMEHYGWISNDQIMLSVCFKPGQD